MYKTSITFHKIFHYAVGLVRQQSGSTSMGFLKALAETIFAFLLVMMMMTLLRGIGVRIRGEFGFYILSGIALFLVHNKIIKVMLAQKKTNSMLPVLAISRGMMIVGSLIHEIYMQLCVTIIFFLACVIYYGHSPVMDWSYLILIYCMTIFWTVSLGTFFMAIMPLSPFIVMKLAMVYRRIGLITSGKMIPGNLLGIIGRFNGLFLINPLFHLIDQARGAIFQQYVPNISNIGYPIKMSIGLFCLSSLIYFVLKKQ